MILVIEKDEILLRDIKDALENNGYEVIGLADIPKNPDMKIEKINIILFGLSMP